MNLQDLPAALVAWAEGVHPELAVAEGQVERIDAALPFCEAAVINSELRPRPGYEESHQRVTEARLMILADPSDPQASARSLERMAATLQERALDDETLGRRVAHCTPGRASFDPPYVRFDDDTEARLATVVLTVTWPL